MPTAEELLKVHPLNAAHAQERGWASAVRDSKLTEESERARWLVKGPVEEDEDFKNRAKLASYSPLTPLIAARVKGTVFKREPARVFPNGLDKLQEFINSAASDGRALGKFSAQACMSALWDRYAVALIDRPALDPQAPPPMTQAEAKEKGVALPYCVLYPADQVLDWRQDREGKLEYIKLDGPIYMQGPDTVREVREITLAGIRVWRIVGQAKRVEGGEVVALADGLRQAKMLPVAVAQFDPIGPVFSRSMLAGALSAELRSFRLLSDIIWDLYIAGHPTLAAWVTDTLKHVGVGASQLIKLNPGSSNGVAKEELAWIEAMLPGLDKQLQAYADARAEIYQQAGVRPAGMNVQPEANSGVQVAWDFETSEAPVLADIAHMASEFEETILEIAALDMGVVNETQLRDISVTYPNDFGLMGIDKLQYNAAWAKNHFGPQHPTTKFLLQRVSAVLLDNAPDKVKDEAQKSIEAEGAYSPEPVGFGFGGDDAQQ